jgi:F0F1-type ATP synthase membrane subunit b/b'
MNILEQLGLNQTYFFQLAIFVGTLILLGQFVFKDFAHLLEMRNQQTKGSEDVAVEVQQKTAQLASQYESRARQVNNEIKTIFDSYREDAGREYEKMVSKARTDSQKLIEETRQRVSVEIEQATKRLLEEVPVVAQAMTNKLLSKSGKA